jgi:hypothetical protein
MRGDYPQDFQTEFENCVYRSDGVFAIAQTIFISYCSRKPRVNRVQTCNQGSFFGFDGLTNTVSKMTCHSNTFLIMYSLNVGNQ